MRKPITVVVVVGLMFVFGALFSTAQASEQLEAERVPNISGGALSVIDPVDASQIQDLLQGTAADVVAAGTNPL